MDDTPDTAAPLSAPVQNADEPVLRIAEDGPAPRRERKGGRLRRWALGLLATGAAVGVVGLAAAGVYYVRATDELPTLEAVRDYSPGVMTRVHAGDGKVIAEYSKQARVYVPIESIPRELQLAFVSAEDQRFYTHGGWDPIGLTRATLQAPIRKARGQRIGGTSTLTQQVAKNFLVGDDYSIRRKVREIAIARRLEEAFSKDEILELYLNEIYFGRGAYGVAAAALKHFGKPMDELSLAEMTYLAAVPKGPANYRLDSESGFRRAKARQSYILGRMVEDGYITQSDADAARAEPLEWVERLEGGEYLASEYFNEEIRKIVFDQYGEDELYEGGLSIRTTLDTDMQLAARRALREGLEAYDRRHGYRGPIAYVSVEDWEAELMALEPPADIGDWQVAVVLEAGDTAQLGLLDVPEDAGVDPETGEALDSEPVLVRGELRLADMAWAGEARANGAVGPKPKRAADALSAGDVILVEALEEEGDGAEGRYALRQVPEVNGAIMAMDPHTGRVLALVGGYSFQQSEFNRATQAFRQPGSSFKPFVYAAALENGYTPASQVLDAPFVIEAPDAEGGFYSPSNYSAGQWYGLSTLRLGIEKSRNAMTVRLANDIGMDKVESLAERFGIYDDVPRELAWSLGAGETTLLRLANAYSMMLNGGTRVEPTLIDRVQDGSGTTIYRHPRECTECYQEEWDGQDPPSYRSEGERVIDPVTAYQSTFMMQGVVDNGSGRTIAELGRPLGGKTGTTNDYKDAWFMGFSPDLVAGVYVGFDRPQTMGRESGGVVAAPIFKAFMKEALDGAPVVPFRIPGGVSLAPVNRNTGEPSFIGAEDYILEAFRPGTEPQIGERGGFNLGIGDGGGFGDGAYDGGGSAGFGFGELESEAANDFEGETERLLDEARRNAVEHSDSTSDATRPDDIASILDAASRSLREPAPEDPQGSDDNPDQPLEDLDDGLY